MPRDELLRRLRAVLERHPEVRVALLFGSRARQRAQPTSDVDLALLGPVDGPGLSAELERALGLAVHLADLGSESVPLREAWIRDGVLVHEGRPGEAAGWWSRAVAQLERDRPGFRLMRDAWLYHVAHHGLADGTRSPGSA